MKLKEIRAVVSGGSSGLGRAVVNRIQTAGGRVVILDLQQDLAESESIPVKEEAVLYLKTDVTSETSVSSSIKQAVDFLGEITLAVNCAGIVQSARVVGQKKSLSVTEFKQVIDVNLIGTFIVCQAVARTMQNNPLVAEGARGVIINTASIAAFDGQIGLSAYAASKGGVASLTLPLAREFASFAVRVMCIAPGLFETPMSNAMPDELKNDLLAHSAFPQRAGKTEEFANLVCHIVENDMLNGEVIRLDAGLRMPA